MKYTATKMAEKLNISRSYLYYLKDSGVVETEVNAKGQIMWTEEVYQRLLEYIAKNHTKEQR